MAVEPSAPPATPGRDCTHRRGSPSPSGEIISRISGISLRRVPGFFRIRFQSVTNAAGSVSCRDWSGSPVLCVETVFPRISQSMPLPQSRPCAPDPYVAAFCAFKGSIKNKENMTHSILFIGQEIEISRLLSIINTAIII